MRNRITTAILVVLLSTFLPAFSAATGQSNEQGAPAKSSSTKTVPNHAVSGVVKSVDAMTLVIMRAGKTPREMTFALFGINEKLHRFAACLRFVSPAGLASSKPVGYFDAMTT